MKIFDVVFIGDVAGAPRSEEKLRPALCCRSMSAEGGRRPDSTPRFDAQIRRLQVAYAVWNL
jgi:hypothetical protein